MVKQFLTTPKHVQHVITIFQALPLLISYSVKGRGEPGSRLLTDCMYFCRPHGLNSATSRNTRLLSQLSMLLSRFVCYCTCVTIFDRPRSSVSIRWSKDLDLKLKAAVERYGAQNNWYAGMYVGLHCTMFSCFLILKL